MWFGAILIAILHFIFLSFQSNKVCRQPSSFLLRLLCFGQEKYIAVLVAFCICAGSFVGSVFCILLVFFRSLGFSTYRLSLSLFFFLYFCFVSTMRRSIFRCVEQISFSCSCERLYVPEAYVSVGVMTILNKRSLRRRRYDSDVNLF